MLTNNKFRKHLRDLNSGIPTKQAFIGYCSALGLDPENTLADVSLNGLHLIAEEIERSESEIDVMIHLSDDTDGRNKTMVYRSVLERHNGIWKSQDANSTDYRTLVDRYPIVALMDAEKRGINLTEEVIERNVKILNRNNRYDRFPRLKHELDDPQLIGTFSHLNPNLHIIDNVYNNHVLSEISRRASINHALNFAYDNIEPCTDEPIGHILALEAGNPHVKSKRSGIQILDPDIPYSLQSKLMLPDRENLEKIELSLRGRLGSKREMHERGLEILKAILNSHNYGSATKDILELRKRLFGLLGLDVVPEIPVSVFQTKIADILEILDKDYKRPFYEMPLSETFKNDGLLRGIDERGRRQHVEFDGTRFTFPYRLGEEDEVGDKHLPVSEVYDAIRRLEVMPTLPVLILALTSAPQIPTIAGAQWKKYGPRELELQASWLDTSDEQSLFLTTEEYPLISLNTRGKTLTSVYPAYLMLGREGIMNSIKNGKVTRLEYRVQG